MSDQLKPRRRPETLSVVLFPHVVTSPQWDEAISRDITTEDFARRIERIHNILTEKAGLSPVKACNALRTGPSKTKEKAAAWARQEVVKLRLAKALKKGAPVRRHDCTSPTQLSDIALTLLESCDSAPGPQLLMLLQELLDVDRHREAQSERHAFAFYRAAWTEAQLRQAGRTNTARQIAEQVGVNNVNVSRWRRDPEYEAAIKKYMDDRLYHTNRSRREKPHSCWLCSRPGCRLTVLTNPLDLRYMWDRAGWLDPSKKWVPFDGVTVLRPPNPIDGSRAYVLIAEPEPAGEPECTDECRTAAPA